MLEAQGWRVCAGTDSNSCSQRCLVRACSPWGGVRVQSQDPDSHLASEVPTQHGFWPSMWWVGTPQQLLFGCFAASVALMWSAGWLWVFLGGQPSASHTHCCKNRAYIPWSGVPITYLVEVTTCLCPCPLVLDLESISPPVPCSFCPTAPAVWWGRFPPAPSCSAALHPLLSSGTSPCSEKSSQPGFVAICSHGNNR